MMLSDITPCGALRLHEVQLSRLTSEHDCVDAPADV